MPPGNRRHRALTDTPWRTPPVPGPALPVADEVHLWRSRLAGTAPEAAGFTALLSPDERARASRFHYDLDRTAFIVARGTLRRLLGQYLNLAPESLTFDYSRFGKPSLTGRNESALNFNVSHAGGYALFGFTSGRAIGVDLEAEDPAIEIDRLTRRFFSPTESRRVLALPPADRVPAFYRTWTRKEAFLKANGAGLSLPLDQFSVTVDRHKAVRVEQINWAPGEAEHWSLMSFTVAEGLPGAAVREGPVSKCQFYEVLF